MGGVRPIVPEEERTFTPEEGERIARELTKVVDPLMRRRRFRLPFRKGGQRDRWHDDGYSRAS